MKKYLCVFILIIFIYSGSPVFAQSKRKEGRARVIAMEYDARVAAIASTVSIGIASQISGIILWSIASEYLKTTVQPLSQVLNDALSEAKTAEITVARRNIEQPNLTYRMYVDIGTALFSIGSAFTLSGIIIAFATTSATDGTTNQASKKTVPFLNKYGAFEVTATDSFRMHFYSNGVVLQARY